MYADTSNTGINIIDLTATEAELIAEALKQITINGLVSFDNAKICRVMSAKILSETLKTSANEPC